MQSPFTEMVVSDVPVWQQFRLRNLSERCLIVKFALALSSRKIGSEIMTTHDGKVVSTYNFNCNNSVNIDSEVFVTASFVEICKIIESGCFSSNGLI